MFRRPPRPFPSPPAAPAALPSALAAEFENLPFGGFAGELATPTPGPVLPGAMPLEIPPADWEAELRGRVEHDDGQPQASAVESMMARAQELGEVEEQPAPPATVLPLEPLPRFQPPPTDWREEEREAAERDAREATARNQAEHEPPQGAYPAKPRRKTWFEKGSP